MIEQERLGNTRVGSYPKVLMTTDKTNLRGCIQECGAMSVKTSVHFSSTYETQFHSMNHSFGLVKTRESSRFC